MTAVYSRARLYSAIISISLSGGDRGRAPWATVCGKAVREQPSARKRPPRALAVRYQPEEETPSAKPGFRHQASLGGPAAGGQGRSGESDAEVAEGRAHFSTRSAERNEGLRTHLDAIEFSFRNIEAIRSQFYDALTPIDQTLVEIERTLKVAHLEAERKLEALT